MNDLCKCDKCWVPFITLTHFEGDWLCGFCLEEVRANHQKEIEKAREKSSQYADWYEDDGEY